MSMTRIKKPFKRARYSTEVIIIMVLQLHLCSPIDWDQVKCSSDADQNVWSGPVDIGRFPWLGVIQHMFYLGGKTQYAVTSAVLIHPGYAIAAAEDIAKIPHETLINNTKLILWYSEKLKFTVDVVDYVLHPEYEEKVTFATLALLELYTSGETGIGDLISVVLPICLPMSGSGTFDNLYAARISDDSGQIRKESMTMNYVPNQDCEEFYYKNQLTYEMMKPRRPLCASVEGQKEACVWDSGVALIARQTWGHWMLLGFSMRGPGCSAPARFVSLHDFVPWVDDVLTKLHPEELQTVKLHVRRQNPFELVMYAADVRLPKEIGQCEREKRGGILYKELSEVMSTKNFGQGFYYVSVMQIASFMCMRILMEVQARTNAALWVEHMCHADATGLHTEGDEGMLRERIECFKYFKTNAYVEFRFYFTFRAQFELSIFGKVEKNIVMPNPFNIVETTLPWHPTASIINWEYFSPYYAGWWNL